MKGGKTSQLLVLSFIISLVLTFGFVFSIFFCINNFTDMPAKPWLWLGFGLSVIVSIVAAVLTKHDIKRMSETSFSFWIKKHSPKLLIGYFCLIFALISVKNQPMWDAESIDNVLSTQWTIFGLSLTIFLVWDVVIVDFLKKRQPKQDNPTDILLQYRAVLEKGSFSQDVETMFSTIILLTINLFLLLVSTALVYISNTPGTVFTQNVLHCTFFFTTNSIASLFIDVLKPLKKEKADMLEKNRVTKEDINNACASIIAQTIIDTVKEDVMGLDPEKYTEEEKEKMVIERLEAFVKSKLENEQPATETKET